MLKTILTGVLSFIIAMTGFAQKLNSFTATLQPTAGANSYLSFSQKKVYTAAEAKSNKPSLELALVITESGVKQIVEWYNLGGKDDKIPTELRGSEVGIASLSWDKELFDKCNSNEDLKRMAGYLTNNSFVHFGSITDDLAQGVKYHCFLVQLENGKRALLWLEGEGNTFKVTVKY